MSWAVAIPALIALLGVAVGAGLSAWREAARFKRDRKRRADEIRRGKLEELIVETELFRVWFVSLAERLPRAIESAKSSREIATKLTEAKLLGTEAKARKLPRIEMLVGIYGPSLQPEFDALMEEFAEPIVDIIKTQKLSNLKKLKPLRLKVSKACSDLRSSAIELTQKTL